MNLGKISFLKRIYLAITDFRMYPYTQKEKLYRAIGYFFKLVIFVSLIIGAFMTANIFKGIPEIIDIYEKYVPDFNVVNGVLQTSENTNKEINNETYLMVDSQYCYDDLNNIFIEESKEHDYYVLVLSDATILGIRINDTIQEMGRIEYTPDMNFNKSQLSQDLEMFKESIVAKISVWIGMTIGIFIALFIVRVWTLIMYIISAYIINFMFGLKLKFTEHLKIAIYVSTMPILLETIALLMVGTISEAVNLISVLVSCVYIFYALRAIKLDSLILGGSGKTAEEKIKNALAHAQQELEKQLEELEKKEESEKEKNNEKKEIESLNNELKEKEENLLKAQKEYEEIIKKALSLNEGKEVNQSSKKEEIEEIKKDFEQHEQEKSDEDKK